MPAATQGDGGEVELSEHPNIIDMGVFEQILEMDDDPDDREFSREIVTGFFEQAEDNLNKISNALEDNGMDEAGKLDELSRLGHFLKGSSATLGLVKVQKSFEKIQNYGKRMDATGNTAQPDGRKSLRDIQTSFDEVQDEYKEAKKLLEQFFKLDS